MKYNKYMMKYIKVEGKSIQILEINSIEIFIQKVYSRAPFD